jgi:4-hydroxy-tetrahydrodipicolinate reductase
VPIINSLSREAGDEERIGEGVRHMKKRIGIAGITGRMGQLLTEEVRAAGADLTGGIGRPGSTKPIPSGSELLADIATLAAASDVVVDFTNAATAQSYAAAMAASGKAWVLGSSGLSDADEAAVTEAARSIPVVYASNFSAGVNLVLALAERMGAALPADSYDAEIIEMHHRQKVDAPSGTAVGMGRAVAKGRGVALSDVIESGRHGHTGARKTGAIGFAALRGGQVVGEHTLIFAAATEHIALTHRAFDRRAFATGAVRAALWAVGRKPGLYSMMDVLGMA